MRRAVLSLLALFAACSGEPSPAGQVLIWARGGDSSTLDPAEIEWGEDVKISQNIQETLVAYRTRSADLEPRLATSWAFSDDGLKATFELRDGVLFHDGSAFDAEDVVFSFQRLLDPNHPRKPRSAPYAPSFGMVEAVKADGPRKVVFTLKTPSAVFLGNLALFTGGIVPSESGDDLGRKPVGTGPYRLARWEKDVKIELERFDRYWGPKPAIPSVIVIPVASPQTAVEKLRRGEAHVVDHPTLSDAQALKNDPAARVLSLPGMNIAFLAFNMKRPPYNHPSFRRAVSLALDRKAINALVLHGLGEPASNVVPPSVWKDVAPPYEEDLAKAKAALAEVRPPPKDVELMYNTLPRPYNPEPQRLAEAVRDQLRRIGLEVKLVAYDRPAFNEKYKVDGHPMYLSGWIADVADPDNFFHPLLHGESKKGLNGSFFDDPAFNTAVSGAQRERDPAKRRALFSLAYARYRAELPTLPLVHLPTVLATAKNVRYELHPIEYRFYEASFGP
ncbi:MAG TPA: ABC transporter substrate-binding protein [Planctomycetota bacterium]